MERKKKIVDALIIFKLFANEEDSDEAIKLRAKHINEEIIIVVPELIFVETLNASRYKKLEKDIWEKANKDICNLQLEVIYLDEFLLNKAIENAFENNLSIYDAIYASLAQIHGAQLITADKKLLKIPNAVSLDKI